MLPAIFMLRFYNTIHFVMLNLVQHLPLIQEQVQHFTYRPNVACTQN